MKQASLQRSERAAAHSANGHDTTTSLTALRAVLRADGQRAVHRATLSLAEAITVEALRKWWDCISNGRLELREPPTQHTISLVSSVQAAVERFGEAVSLLPIEEAAHHLSLLYTGLLPGDWRSKHGIYYTPPALARRLLDQAEQAGVDWSKANVLDPAAGAGAFLVPVVQRVKSSLGECSPAIAVQNITARVRGYELDAFAAWLGQVFVDAVLLPLTNGRHARAVIDVCDALGRADEGERFDLVVGNPPFGRQQLSAKMRKQFSRSLYGHANLYGVFIDLAIRKSRRDGLVSFLTPSSFLAGEYFKNLRGLLWEEAPPTCVDFVTLRKGVFEDVLQETVLATYRKGGARQEARVSFIHPEPGQQIVPEAAGSLTLPRESTAPWIMARHDDEARLVERLRAMPSRLIDWGYKISTGPLVWNRFKDQLNERPGKGRVPLIWAESVTSNGQFVFRAERRNHKPYFSVQPGDEWLVVSEPCVLLQRTTAKEQARRLIAAEMPAKFLSAHQGGITVENHLNMLLPLHKRPEVTPTLLSLFLNTPAADRAFRCISGSVAVSAYELENLPLPDPAEFRRLVGKRVTAESVCKVAAEMYDSRS